MILFNIMPFFLLIFLYACGETKDSSKVTPDDGFDEDPFQVVTYSSSVFAKNSRFSGYSFAAGRVTVIDPDKEVEIWGRFVGTGYSDAFGLPGIDGVGLVSENEFKIVSLDHEKVFQLPSGGGSRWRWAREALAFAFVAKDGSSFKVIRNLGGINWEEKEFSVPSKLREEQRSFVPLMSKDGLILALFVPDTGSYTTFHADDSSPSIEGPNLVCANEKAKPLRDGDAINVEEFIRNLTAKKWTSGAINSNTKVLYIGNEKGDIAFIDISKDASCHQPDDWNKDTQLMESDVRRMNFISNGQLVVAQNNGELHFMEQTNQTISLKKTVEDICGYPTATPVGINEITSQIITVSCYSELLEEFIGIEDGPISIVTYSIAQSKILSTINLIYENVASIGADPDKLRLFELIDGGLGELRIIDLTDGSSHTKKGIFLDNILDRL